MMVGGQSVRSAGFADRGLACATFAYSGEAALADVMHWTSGTKSDNPDDPAQQIQSGCNHVVVVLNGEIVCDPSGNGIVGPSLGDVGGFGHFRSREGAAMTDDSVIRTRKVAVKALLGNNHAGLYSKPHQCPYAAVAGLDGDWLCQKHADLRVRARSRPPSRAAKATP